MQTEYAIDRQRRGASLDPGQSEAACIAPGGEDMYKYQIVEQHQQKQKHATYTYVSIRRYVHVSMQRKRMYKTSAKR